MARTLNLALPNKLRLKAEAPGEVASEFKRLGGALAIAPVNFGTTCEAEVEMPAGHTIDAGDTYSVKFTEPGGTEHIVTTGPVPIPAPAPTPAAPTAGPTAPAPAGPIGAPPVPPAPPMGMPTWQIVLITLALAALVLGGIALLWWGVPALFASADATPADLMPSWTAFGNHTAGMVGLLPSMKREHEADLEAKKAAERKAATAADEARLARETAERRPADMAASLEGLGASVKTTFGITPPPAVPPTPPAPPAPPAIVLGPTIKNPVCGQVGCIKTDLDPSTHGH